MNKNGIDDRARTLIAGGSSGMGLALAGQLLAQGQEVIVVGRSDKRLAQAAESLGDQPNLQMIAADITNESDIARLFDQTGKLNHIVSTAADITGAYALLPDLDLAAARRAMDSKIIGPLLLAKYGARRLAPGGSITFTSGIAAYRPAPKGSVVAAINGALESLTYALAIELAPLRVNVVSPGWVDTPIWESIAGSDKTERLAAMAKRLLVGRIGAAEDIAQAIASLMHNPFITGTLLHVDGGQRLI
ncbi:SDR family oxidoreductase [Methylovirgula sp. 4M-Z18]|uniref:SDR family oxidoreductase n=1 Tax=Methylovirgula sp. 4M-Z18 TaxID=2293567 RepID=UPI000E2F5B22|nr:SDR family oxidoreductase [Methylovirgula sp. 4M-Z18]RFB79626.1 SDR family oxidoreductase [Methylovirgula sp. 4M-Z18]